MHENARAYVAEPGIRYRQNADSEQIRETTIVIC